MTVALPQASGRTQTGQQFESTPPARRVTQRKNSLAPRPRIYLYPAVTSSALALPLSEAACFSPDGSLLAVSIQYSGMVLRLDRATMRGEIITRIEPSSTAVEFAFSPDGRTLATRFEESQE